MDKEYLDFIKHAYSSGLCDEYKNEIKNCHEDKAQLVRLALRQQSIPYIATKMRDGVITKEYVQKAFSGYLNGVKIKDCDGVSGYTYSWYVDYDYNNDLLIETDVAHISYTVGASVVIPITKCPIIYVSNRSNIHLVCDGYNSVKIYLFDNSKVTIEDADHESQIVVYKYSENATIKESRFCFGDVKQFKKQLKI